MGPADPPRRWYRLTPDRILAALFGAEGLLLLSERFEWFAFNEHKGWTVLIAVATVGLTLLGLLVWFAASLLLRRRFQFGVRSLLVLVVAVAVPCSWLAVEMQNAREQREAIREIQQTGGDIRYDRPIAFDGPRWIPTGTPEPTWLQELLGRDFFDTAVGASVRGREAKRLICLTQLRVLCIYEARDDTLDCLEHLPQLRELCVGSPVKPDRTAIPLVSRWFDVPSDTVTDAGLAHIAKLPRLQRLWIGSPRVSDDGFEQLRQLLPKCEVNDHRRPVAPLIPIGPRY